jgi:Phosphotransferase enzyme family
MEETVPATKSVSEQRDEAELRRFIELTLRKADVSAPAIVGVERARSKHSSTYETEVLSVRLAGGAELQLFLKDFGAYGHVKDQMTQRRWREVCVYRNLLSDADLGTARYYGAIWDESRQRFWLLLEFVEGTQVRWCEFDSWVDAVRWLGRMQAHFSRCTKGLLESDFLVAHDAEFFGRTAEMALRSVSLISSKLYARLEAILTRYDELVALMADQPKTLVHGGYHPQNVLVDGSTDSERVCPIDWEEAALGARLYDFAYFSDGFDPQRLTVLLDAYAEAAAADGLQAQGGAGAARVVRGIQVHKSLGTLAKAYERHFPRQGVEKLVGMVESAAAAAL